jgi:hypothetical protein
MNALVEHSARLYGLPVIRIHAAQKGYRNTCWPIELADGTMVNFMVYKAEPGILMRLQRANMVSNTLAEHGFPARHQLDPRIIKLTGLHSERYGCLYAYLSGHTIPWEAYTRRHLKLLGAAMSDMHKVLRLAVVSESSQHPHVCEEYVQIVRRMERYFADPAVSDALARKIGLHIAPGTLPTLRLTLRASSHLRHRQMLHMDFVRGNILFEGTGDSLTISGILDFEKTALGHPIIDVARTLAFLLVDCKYRSERDVRKYFLFSGYHRHGASRLPRVRFQHHGAAIDLFEELVDLFLVYDFYKFLRHNPYESLAANEHFARTSELLAHRGRILRV